MNNKIIYLVLIFIFSCTKNDFLQKIYFNGYIWTGDLNNPRANAIVVSDDIISFVGTDEEALLMSNENTIKINLNGKFVTPGLIDNHVHFINGGMQLAQVDLHDVTSKEEFQKRIYEADTILPEGKWMLGGNWDHEKWGGNYPDKSWIDDIVNDRPVLLDRLDGHMALANSMALDLGNITEKSIDPIGGIIKKDNQENPTGILKDNAIDLCRELVPADSQDDLDQALHKAIDFALSKGITQVHDMGSFSDLITYHRALSSGELKIRVKLFTWYTNWEDILEYVKQHGPGNDWLKWDGVKGMIDGSLGSKTAWMHKPYVIDDNSSNKERLSTVGLLTIKDTTHFKRMLREIDYHRIQNTVHAIGDRANDWILDEFSKISLENGKRDRRFRIEHAQHLSPQAINRFSEQKVIPSMQPYHLYDDGSWAHNRIERDLLARSYVFKSLIADGANLTFGSDWTVAPLNPMTGIYAAVTRKTRDGKNPDGWFENEKINVEDALMCYTINNAYSAFWENTTGSITIGKNADFVVHSHNLLNTPPDSVLNNKVLRTVVGGTDYLF